MANIILKTNENLDADLLYKYRENFKQNAYKVTDRRFVPSVLKNFYFDRPLYGRVDAKMNSMFLSEVYLKELAPVKSGNIVLAQDFVKDAFREMSIYFARGLATNQLKLNGPYSSLVARRGFSNFHESYATFLTEYTNNFIEHIRDLNIKKRVISFDSFVNEFLFYMKKNIDNQIITRSKFIETTLCDPFMTGLSIGLAFDEYNNDLNKYQNYYLDNNFNFFLESCRRFGFIVDKDAPWTIHFDLNSDASKKYLTPRSLQNQNEVFETRYYKAYFSDAIVIRDFLKFSYDSFFANENRITYIDGVTKCQGPIIKIINKEDLSNNTFNTKYDDFYWLKIYLQIKMIEENFSLIKGEIDRVFFDVQQILLYGIPNAVEQNTQEERYYEAVDYINEVVLRYKKSIDYKKIKEY
jgi:hypothetical protein